MLTMLIRDKRGLLALGLCLVIAMNFWLSIRLPALNEKAVMGDTAVLQDGLSFDALLPVDAEQPLVVRVLYSTINWANTNRQGMTFGVLIAAALMTLLTLTRGISAGGRFGNSVVGAVLGAPLGVCVNCAAPIACGLRAAGASAETALAAMIASPTLNIIVLTMLFSLFPPYIAVTKIVLTVAVLIVLVPAITRFIPVRGASNIAAIKNTAMPGGIWADTLAGEVDAPPAAWRDAGRWLFRTYGRNLWFIVRYTVPLMLLAGLLGALLINLLPWSSLTDALPAYGGVAAWPAVFGVAALGIFLPAPIAFDVIISAILSGAGLPVGYTMTLLFTLGVFSIYSFFIVGRFISWTVAVVLTASLLLIGVAGGAAAHFYDQWMLERQEARIFRSFATSPAPDRRREPISLTRAVADDFFGGLPAARKWSPMDVSGPPGIGVEKSPFLPRSEPGAHPFIRNYGDTRGIVLAKPDYYKQFSFRSVAVADVHGDGWVDLLVATENGPRLFANIGGERFVEQRIEVPTLAALDVTVAALADLDDDGWLDLVAAGYRAGNHIVFNDHGRFNQAGYQKAHDSGAPLIKSYAFGDLDRDGDLEVLLGNTTLTRMTLGIPETSRNTLWWNDGSDLRAELLPALPGPTLSTLISDFDADGRPDYFTGNDYMVSDFFYIGKGDGEFQVLRQRDKVVPYSTWSTMTIDTADIDNDLVPETYIGQVTGVLPGQLKKQTVVYGDEVCNEHTEQSWRIHCKQQLELSRTISSSRKSHNAALCLDIDDPNEQDQCVAASLHHHAVRGKRDPALCELFPPRWGDAAYTCRLAIENSKRSTKKAARKLRRHGLRQMRGKNVLLVKDGAKFTDRATELGVEVGGWTWNAKFADLDNDQWQDLYIANGMFSRNKHESNMFYHNRQGERFQDETREFGLTHYFASGAYAYADLDNDGDLDIVMESPHGPIWIYKNAVQTGNSIIFEFRDGRGNSRGIGNKVFIRYGDNGEMTQFRELKSGGGYLSFDQPVAHFGLGPHTSVEKVEVHWSTGETSVLSGEFDAGFNYRIRRGMAVP